ncbi:hypothetical protein BD769DRAFT_1462708 [Suillus cothurnatus]|nr:hypothetical protein BD769DRAFT_1462708 [Suillus cothurnatus]
MSSTAISTITYPCPTPTTNILDFQQLMRLIRSARKLGTVMSTTPYLLEADVPITLLPIGSNKKSMTGKALKRQGSIFKHYHRDSPSVTSFSSASTTFVHSPSASLVSLPSSMRSRLARPPLTFPPTPRTPSFDAAELRRKRMAKLARHLGENVPPELVTVRGPPAQFRSEEDVPKRKRHSMSTRTNSDWVGEWNRSDIRDVQRELRNLRAVWW